MHGGVRVSLSGGGAGPRPGQAPPDALWEANDEGDDAMTSEQLRRAEVELLEGVAVVRGDEDGQGGVTGGAHDDSARLGGAGVAGPRARQSETQ